MMKVTILAVLACAGASLGQWSDDFNRADGPIGGSWTATPPTALWNIVLNQGTHVSAGVNDIIQYNGASMPYAGSVSELDVFCPGTLSQFSAVMIGLGGTDTIMVKIQDQVGTTPGFSNIGIYHRSGTSWAAWTGTGTGFAALTAPFLSAHMKVYFSDPDTIVVDLDTDFNGAPDQTYTKTGVSTIAANLGTGYGIGAWAATALFDNWKLSGGTPPTCYPDCNGDGALNLSDFGCFQTAFALGQPYADCNGDGVLNLSDFGCFQTKFALGCP